MMELYKDREWLKGKYLEEKLNIYQIANLCDVDKNRIWRRLIKHNIPRRSYSEAHHLRRKNNCVLSSEAIEWVNGEMLGDGNLNSRSIYSAKFSYGSKYLEYAQYVSDTLKSFGIERVGGIYERIDKNWGNISYYVSSRSYEELYLIYKQWYPEGKKIVPKDIVLTPLVCRQWYIGDGSLRHNKEGRPNICLSTCGFTIPDVEWLIKQLIDLGLKATRLCASNTIHIWADSTKEFLKYIGRPKVQCYQYKFNY